MSRAHVVKEGRGHSMLQWEDPVTLEDCSMFAQDGRIAIVRESPDGTSVSHSWMRPSDAHVMAEWLMEHGTDWRDSGGSDDA